MERSGTNDFKDDRHPEKYLRVFYCGYHRRGKLVFYKKVSDSWYLPLCHRENLNLIYVELLFTGNIPSTVFFVNKVHRKPEICIVYAANATYLCLSQARFDFLCIAKRVTGHGVNSNSYCSLVSVLRGICCRHKVLAMKNLRVCDNTKQRLSLSVQAGIARILM